MEVEPKITNHSYQVEINTSPEDENNTSVNKMITMVFNFTKMTKSMLVWIGTSQQQSNEVHEDLNPCLARDWSCSLPPSPSFPAVSTQLNSLDPTHTFSQALAQKIAQRFKIQVFVSIDLPLAVIGSESNLRIQLEKNLFALIKTLL